MGPLTSVCIIEYPQTLDSTNHFSPVSERKGPMLMYESLGYKWLDVSRDVKRQDSKRHNFVDIAYRISIILRLWLMAVSVDFSYPKSVEIIYHSLNICEVDFIEKSYMKELKSFFCNVCLL